MNDMETPKATVEHQEQEAEFSAKETKKLLRKIDMTLLPLLSLMYLLSFLDRANIGNARISGLEEDLGMTGKWDYSVSPVHLFFSYYLFCLFPLLTFCSN